MTNYKKLLLVTIISCVLLGIFGSAVHAQSNNPPTSICVVGQPDTSNFPYVGVEFRALDINKNSVSYLDRSSVSIKEEGEISQLSSLSPNVRGVGLNINFVFDRGNRTDQKLVKAVLQRFATRHMASGLDTVSLFSAGNENERSSLLFGPETSANNFSVTIENLSVISRKYPGSGLMGIEEAINSMRGQNTSCSEPNIVLGIIGDDVVASNFDKISLIEKALNANTKIVIVHSVKAGSSSSKVFEEIASGTGGEYYPINYDGAGEFSDLDQTLFTQLVDSRLSFTANYRSKVGVAGQRNVEILLSNGLAQTDSNKTSYAVLLSSPKITLLNPTDGSKIVRNAKTYVDPEFVYDVDTQNIEWRVDWEDSYPREITLFRINMITSTGTETIGEITPSTSDDDLHRYEWDLREIRQEGANPYGIQIEAIDELGLVGKTNVSNVIVENFIPEAVAAQTTKQIQRAAQLAQWQLYILYGLLLILVILAIIFRKRIQRAFAEGGAINVVVEKVRKTIIGGARGGRRKVKAKLNVHRPVQEMKSIFAESVILGRDPKQADITFFTPAAECSVSGKHAQLILKSDGWQIIGISSSQSPIFIDGEQQRLHTEIPITTGTKIELGYEDMGSAFFEFIEVDNSRGSISSEPSLGIRKTKPFVEDEYKPTEIPVNDNLLMDDQDQDDLSDLTNDPDEFFNKYRLD
ncbi:MAG: FHA domain-containing protein [Candidatus Helarchaeota archaeon]